MIWANTNLGWNVNTEHEFFIKHRPRTGIINVQIKRGGSKIVDTGDIQVNVSSGMLGGRVGVFCSSQDNVLWTDMSYKCQGKTKMKNLSSTFIALWLIIRYNHY